MEYQQIDISLLDISPIGIVILDDEGDFTYANQEAEKILGLNANQISNRAYDSPEWHLADFEGNAFPGNQLPFFRVMESNTSVFDVELAIQWPDGTQVYMSVNASPIHNSKGEVEGVIATLMNVTDRVQKELEIQESKQRYKDLFDNLVDEVHIWKFITNEQDEVVNWELVEANPVALKVWGKSLNEVQGKTATEIFGNNAIDTFKSIVEEVYRKRKPIRWDKYFEATRQHLSMDSIPFGDYFISTGRDITDIKKTEKELIRAKEKAENSEKKLKQTLAEKEALLMEVHHRVKNNLALISAMLYLQEHMHDDAALSGLIMDVQSRIKSIANVHELIYENESFAEINADQYIEKIYDQVQKIYINEPKKITFNSRLDPLFLMVEEAIPLALMVNEVLANALKHAFKGEMEGKIDVELKANGRMIELTIEDNGKGLPKDFSIDQSNGLGVTLIRQFTKQLGGSFELRSGKEGGTFFCLSFEKTENQ